MSNITWPEAPEESYLSFINSVTLIIFKQTRSFFFKFDFSANSPQRVTSIASDELSYKIKDLLTVC